VDFDIGVVMPTMAPSTIEPAAIAPKMAAQITKVVPMSCTTVSRWVNEFSAVQIFWQLSTTLVAVDS